MEWPTFLSSKTKRFMAAALIAAAVLCYFIIRILKIRRNVDTIAAHPDKNVQAFLSLIRWCEGTDGPRGYNTIVGYSYFSSFADHPRQKNKSLNSTAAGAYQIVAGTWDECRRILALPDFTPESQNKAAIYLFGTRRKALADVQAGRLLAAIQKCCPEWASFPVVTSFTDKLGFHQTGKSYWGGQPAKSLSSIRQKFTDLGGTITA